MRQVLPKPSLSVRFRSSARWLVRGPALLREQHAEKFKRRKIRSHAYLQLTWTACCLTSTMINGPPIQPQPMSWDNYMSKFPTQRIMGDPQSWKRPLIQARTPVTSQALEWLATGLFRCAQRSLTRCCSCTVPIFEVIWKPRLEATVVLLKALHAHKALNQV